ncbi:MAG TPA: LysR family transcriptional regulator [Clostridiales bacterium]|nr:LysR family transcriptional regulator [Clostridiales bacterium]
MNLEQLKIFISVVEYRSFTKAAESLYISHSTTSRNVAALEESLGVQLLLRDNRSVRLTPAGEILYNEGIKLLKKIESIESAVKNAGLGIVGKLSVATVDLYFQELWNGYDDFCREYPEVVLGMYTRDITEICPQVNGGEVDVGVTFSYALPDDLSEFDIRAVARESFCVVAAPDHPLAEKKSLELSDLQSTNYISLPFENYNFIKDPEQQARFAMAVREESVVPTLESLFLQVRSGNGVSLVPQPVARGLGEGCAILEIEDIDTSFDVVLIWRLDNLNPTLPLFVDTVMKRVEEKAKEGKA